MTAFEGFWRLTVGLQERVETNSSMSGNFHPHPGALPVERREAALHNLAS
jgi:hypothetical protein